MMKFVSWQQYLIFLLIVTILYYLLVWIFFFRSAVPFIKDVRELFSRPDRGEDQPDEMMSVAQHIIDELRPLFVKGYEREELFAALHAALKKYNSWNEPGFRALINQFIIAESESKCSIRPGEVDVSRLWLG
jgi:hypothetical protein